MKLGECIRTFGLSIRVRTKERSSAPIDRTYQIRVPHSDRVLHAYLPHEQTVHPSERKLHELDVLRLQMRSEWGYVYPPVRAHSVHSNNREVHTIYSSDKFRHALDAPVDAGLAGDIVVLNPVQQA